MRVVFLYSLALWLCLSTYCVQAQKKPFYPPNWQMGVELGGAISTPASGSSTDPYHSRCGHLGLYVQHQLSKQWALRSGAHFSFRNFHNRYLSHHWGIGGVNIPILGVYTFNPRVDAAFGADLNINSLYRYSSMGQAHLVQAGLRVVLGINWTPRLRTAAYGVYLIRPVGTASTTMPPLFQNLDYMLFGINISYRLTKSPAEKGVYFAGVPVF